MSIFNRFDGEQSKHHDMNQNQTLLENKFHSYVVEEIKKGAIKENDLSRKMKEITEKYLEDEGIILSYEQKSELMHHVLNEIKGYGPISPLLLDRTITEVMVNGPQAVYVEKHGKIEKTDVTFKNDEHVIKVIERIITPLGRRIDEKVPMVDARLPDGSRINAIIPPLALNGPVLTIRKFSETPFQMNDLIKLGTLSEDMASFLQNCIKAKLNLFISGGTGAGKTSTLNVLSSFIDPKERVVTIEDAAELRLSQEHVVSLESRPQNIEGEGEVNIRDLVKNTLRMRPDRIIVGEVRSAEALDMLQAMNTGHDGSMGTGHANTPRDLLSRLETMVLMAGYQLPIRAIREQIAGAIDLIIHQSRFKDGTRKITHVTEVLGLEGDTIVLQDLFRFQAQGYDSIGKVRGEFLSTGIRPHCSERFDDYGITMDSSWFQRGQKV